mmetsp:Transcript_7940/g.14724  ORF Transcript_7940/g.14724 Transcript_7940/m.14724 type:complete len:258 (-) Transcript_7940:453-1226(-)
MGAARTHTPVPNQRKHNALVSDGQQAGCRLRPRSLHLELCDSALCHDEQGAADRLDAFHQRQRQEDQVCRVEPLWAVSVREFRRSLLLRHLGRGEGPEGPDVFHVRKPHSRDQVEPGRRVAVRRQRVASRVSNLQHAQLQFSQLDGRALLVVLLELQRRGAAAGQSRLAHSEYPELLQEGGDAADPNDARLDSQIKPKGAGRAGAHARVESELGASRDFFQSGRRTRTCQQQSSSEGSKVRPEQACREAAVQRAWGK